MMSSGSPADDNDPAGEPDGRTPGASRIGAELHAARLRLGWALPDVAASLRIQPVYLQAIEDGRIAGLPGNAYALGYLRSYAAMLGLDAAEIARRFRAETRGVNRKTELAFPTPVAERGVPGGAVALLGMLLILGAYAGWYRFSGNTPAAETVLAVPERLAPLASLPAPPPVPSPANPPPQLAGVLPDPSTSALAAPVRVQPLPLAPPAPSPPIEPASTAPPVAVGAPVSAAAAVMGEGRIKLRVKADAWIQVRERQGQVLLSRIMHAGDVWPVPNGTQLLLSTGNAGGTELLVDGEVTPALGGSGAIRRDVLLDPDALKGGSTARPATQ